jgi:hypothetical protein
VVAAWPVRNRRTRLTCFLPFNMLHKLRHVHNWEPKMKLKALCSVAVGLMLGMGLQMSAEQASKSQSSFDLLILGISEAQANSRAQNRRVARRTSRRTSRRVARRHSIAGCAVWRPGYWNCGGVYYRSVVEGGTTVYVVVNP